MNTDDRQPDAGANTAAMLRASETQHAEALAQAVELLKQRRQCPPQTLEEIVGELKALLTGVRNQAGEEQDPNELVRSLLQHLLKLKGKTA